MRTAFPIALAVVLSGCIDKSQDNEPLAENQPPVADAGDAISQSADSAVVLDGGASFDPDGDNIAYHWEFDSVATGSALAEQESPFPGNDTMSATTEFWADAPGTYVVKLTVMDEYGAQSAPDYVIIDITAGNPPIADAGTDITGTEGDTFTLDGSHSYDPLGRDLSYAWTFASVPTGSALTGLTQADSVNPTFVADEGGVYIASLIVDNSLSTSDPDTVVIRVSTADPQPPVALAGDDITDSDCTEITLDGSASYDPNGDTLSYQWSMQVVPEGSSVSNSSFTDRTAASTTFIGDVAGTYVVALSVSDGTAWSTPDLVTLTLEERSYNTGPSVEAGDHKAVDGGEATCEESGYSYACEDCASPTQPLGDDATASDPDGDALTYKWTVVSGEAEIEDDTALSTNVTLNDAAPTEPGSCEEIEYEFQLAVTDCTGEVVTDTVSYTVSCCGTSDTGAK